MKLFFKNNKLYIISLLILIIWFLISLCSFIRSFEHNKFETKKTFEQCITENNSDCKDLETKLAEFKMPPAPLLYTYIITNGDYSIQILSITLVLFVSIPAIYLFYKKIKNKYYKFEIQRKGYKAFIIDNYKSSFKSLMILPLFLIITFIITCFVSNFKFQYLIGEVEYEELFWTSKEYARANWKQYFSIMFFVLVLHSQFYVNLAYITFYKVRSFLTNILLTFIIYIFSQIVVVYAVQVIIFRVLSINNSDLLLSLEDPLCLTYGMEINNYWYMILSSILYVIISGSIVFFLYRKKERFVIINE